MRARVRARDRARVRARVGARVGVRMRVRGREASKRGVVVSDQAPVTGLKGLMSVSGAMPIMH